MEAYEWGSVQDKIIFGEGAATLSQVNNLISAMAAFAPETGCSSTLPKVLWYNVSVKLG